MSIFMCLSISFNHKRLEIGFVIYFQPLTYTFDIFIHFRHFQKFFKNEPCTTKHYGGRGVSWYLRIANEALDTSSSVGFCPIERITPSNSLVDIDPLPSYKGRSQWKKLFCGNVHKQGVKLLSTKVQGRWTLNGKGWVRTLCTCSNFFIESFPKDNDMLIVVSL